MCLESLHEYLFCLQKHLWNLQTALCGLHKPFQSLWSPLEDLHCRLSAFLVLLFGKVMALTGSERTLWYGLPMINFWLFPFFVPLNRFI
jgi:hypothetical protein